MTDPVKQILPPNYKMQFVNQDSTLTNPGINLLQQIWAQIVNTNQVTPCTAVGTSNLYVLSPFPTPAAANIPKYSDYAFFTFVADVTSTGAVTADVEIPQSGGATTSLGTKKVYKDGGSTQAGSGDIVINRLYILVYNSALDSGNGGFVLK